MIKSIWKCSNCGHTKITKYKDTDFNSINSFTVFYKKSIHFCPHCQKVAVKIVDNKFN